MRISLNRVVLVLFFLIPCCVFGDSLESMISNLISDKLGNNISDIELSFENKSKAILSNIRGQNINNVQLSYFAQNYSSFKVSVTLENERVYDLFGRYNAYIDLPVPSKMIKTGTIITEAEISSVRSPISKMKSGFITSPDELLGMQVKRALAPGALIRHSDLVKPQVVRQGDGLEIVYNRGNIKLRTSGVAIQSGAVGDTVRVKNETTGTVIYGIVKAKNLVEVGGE
jgi:flagella basal body P-ring formation protein FlgA